MRVRLITSPGAGLQRQEVEMWKVQFIRTPKGKLLAVLPRAEYEALAKAADRYDHAQLGTVIRRIKQGREMEYPLAVVEAMADGPSADPRAA